MSDAKPEAASIDVTSPDFQKAVAAAVAAQMETITASLAMKVAAQQSAPGDTLGVLSSPIRAASSASALTAGASAPDVLVQEVIARLRVLGAVSVRTLDGIQETIKFQLPKGLKL